MRILIALKEEMGINSRLSEHFGHCSHFAIYDSLKKELKIIKNEINHSESIQTPVEQIKKFYPDVVFSLGMGNRAIKLFNKENIKIKTGDYLVLGEVIENLGSLKDLNEGCGH